jgi:hypothetical protein
MQILPGTLKGISSGPYTAKIIFIEKTEKKRRFYEKIYSIIGSSGFADASG